MESLAGAPMFKTRLETAWAADGLKMDWRI
jgi:hypothetical protein